MKVLKVIINILLILILSITITLLPLLFIANTTISYEDDYKSNNDNSIRVDIFYLSRKVFKQITAEELQKIDKITPEIIHEYVDDELEKRNIPKDALDYVLKEDNYQELFNTYKKDAVLYLKGEKEKPTIPRERVNKMINRGLTKYNNDHKEKPVNIEKIETEVEDLTKVVDEKIEEFKENKIVTSTISIVTNDGIKIALFVSSIVIGIILLVLNKPINGLNKISISLVLAGLLLIICPLIININLFSSIKDFVVSTLSFVINKVRLIGIIYLVIGILLFIVTTIINKKNKNA